MLTFKNKKGEVVMEESMKGLHIFDEKLKKEIEKEKKEEEKDGQEKGHGEDSPKA